MDLLRPELEQRLAEAEPLRLGAHHDGPQLLGVTGQQAVPVGREQAHRDARLGEKRLAGLIDHQVVEGRRQGPRGRRQRGRRASADHDGSALEEFLSQAPVVARDRERLAVSERLHVAKGLDGLGVQELEHRPAGVDLGLMSVLRPSRRGRVYSPAGGLSPRPALPGIARSRGTGGRPWNSSQP